MAHWKFGVVFVFVLVAMAFAAGWAGSPRYVNKIYTTIDSIREDVPASATTTFCQGAQCYDPPIQ